MLNSRPSFDASLPPQERSYHVPTTRLTQNIHGRRGMSGDTALRLEHWFGVSAQFSLNLQSNDIRVAQEKAGREIAKLPVRQGTGIRTPHDV
jgi:plasmid maintenance system antidote protein VapI